MFEWILVGMIWAAAMVMIAYTIEEAVFCTRPLRSQSKRHSGSLVPENRPASRVHDGNDDEAQKRAA